jgi:hypothetical protein
LTVSSPISVTCSASAERVSSGGILSQAAFSFSLKSARENSKAPAQVQEHKERAGVLPDVRREG